MDKMKLFAHTIYRMRQLAAIFTLLGILAYAAQGLTASNGLTSYRHDGVTIVHVSQAHPFYFIGPDGKPQGMVVDFWNRWSDETNIPVHFDIAPWKETLSMVLEDKGDIHGGLMMNEERSKLFEFSQPLFTIVTALMSREGEGFDTDSLVEKGVIGLVAGSYPGILLKRKYPGVQIREYETPQQVVNALADRHVTGVVMDVPTFHFNNIQRQFPVGYEVVSTLAEEQIYAGVRKGDTELISIIDHGFSQISAKDRKTIQERWFVMEQKAENSAYAIYIFACLFILALGLFIHRMIITPSS